MAGFSSWLNDQISAGKKGWAKYNNRKFKNAAMAACARAAMANGVVSDEEKQATAAVIAGIPELAPFNPTELYTIFEGYCNGVPMIAKITCDRAIGELKSDPGAAAACVQIMLAVCNSDGNFDADEKKVVREVCGVLGIDATPYVS
jgi:tellurite resistance protein TerB